MSEYKIDKNIPMPSGASNGLTSMLRQLEVGDSVVIPLTLRHRVHYYGSRLEIKVAVRKVDDKNMRLWRVK